MSWYDTKQTDGELWGMWSTLLLLSLPGSLRPGVVAPERILSMGQIVLNCVLLLNWIVWNRTVYIYKNGFGIEWLIMVDMQ